jgi:hypothetical protein
MIGPPAAKADQDRVLMVPLSARTSRERPAGAPPVDRASLRPPFVWEIGRINLDMVCFRARPDAQGAPTAKRFTLARPADERRIGDK